MKEYQRRLELKVDMKSYHRLKLALMKCERILVQMRKRAKKIRPDNVSVFYVPSDDGIKKVCVGLNSMVWEGAVFSAEAERMRRRYLVHRSRFLSKK